MMRIARNSRLDKIYSYDDATAAARRVLPRGLYDYITGGAEDELTLDKNTEAFHDLVFRPRQGNFIADPEVNTTLFGTDLDFPVLNAPCGAMRLFHPEGELGLARAASAAGTIQVVSSASGYTLEEIAGVGGPLWFQLYKFGSRSTMESLVERAQSAGYRAMVVTIDTMVGGRRERDYRNGFQLTMRPNLQNGLRILPQLAVRPIWTYKYVRDGLPFELGNTVGMDGSSGPQLLTAMARTGTASHSPDWEDIAWIRANWDGPLLIKGILTSEDAQRAIDAGADGVVVSNHGGRQLDGAPTSVDALVEVVDAVGDKTVVLLDSGVRRGSDVVKALAIGARAVLIGRVSVIGLAIGGQGGVEHMLRLLREGVKTTMQLIGCSSIKALDRSWLQPLAALSASAPARRQHR